MIKNPILLSVSNWFQRNFSDSGTVGLFFTLLVSVLAISFYGKLLAPILVSVAIAYLLSSVVKALRRWHMPELAAVWLVYVLFIALVLVLILGLLPLLSHQLGSLVHELPHLLDKARVMLNQLAERYPAVLGDAQFMAVTQFVKEHASSWGQTLLSFSWSSISGLIEIVLYLILVPVMVLFFLKDRKEIIQWLRQFLPANPGLTMRVWGQVNRAIGHYVQGRIIEIVVVSVVSALVFVMLGLSYPYILGLLVGLSVIVPYVGAVIATIPVLIVGLVQWGLTVHFAWLMVAYAAIIAIDGNVLVPLLFAETMNLHPIVIIISVLIFGGLWGFWGVFFAIPLATVVRAILTEWPRNRR